MKKFLTLLTFAMLSISAVDAQQGALPQERPEGPLFRPRAPEFARWTVTVNPGKPDPSRSFPGYNSKVMVTKTKHLIHEQAAEANGVRWEKWCQGNFQLSKRGNEPFRTYASRGSTLSADKFTDYSKTDFPGWEWASEASDDLFAGIRTVANRECIVLEEQPKDGKPGATGFVDLRTRYPVVLTRGDETRLYEFQPSPQNLLTPPADVQKAFNNAAAKEARLKAEAQGR